MSARRVRFKQADVERALRAATAVGMTVARCEIDAEGKIVVVYGKAEPVPAAAVSDLEAWKARRNARAP